MSDVIYTLAGKRVAVVGHRGLVGSALVRRLAEAKCELLTLGRESADLRRQSEVEDWFTANRPDTVFLAAAKVGGIVANSSFPGDFLYDNLMIEANVIEAARKVGVSKLIVLGSSCIYPKHSAQPIKEDYLLTGPLEPTNEWYAIAKIAGIKLCQAYREQYSCDYIAVQPTNLYGRGDNFHLTNSHVVPGLIRKAHEAKVTGASEMVVWGTGTPLREFLHVDDLADALVFLSERYSDDRPINVGTGEEITIADLARKIAHAVGYQGAVTFDSSKPDGTPRKLVDSTRLAELGWRASIDLQQGLIDTYDWYLREQSSGRSSEARVAA